MQDLLLSDDFRRYRKKLIDMIIKEIDLKDVSDLSILKGKLEMARKVLKLPEDLLTGNAKTQANANFVEDFNEVQARFVRAYVEE